MTLHDDRQMDEPEQTPKQPTRADAWANAPGALPVSELFLCPNNVIPLRVQELMIAVHNLRGADGRPAEPAYSGSTTGLLDLLTEAVLLLMEKGQPGVMGYKK